MFKTLLIANRGEIACRIARSAQRLGIKAVAVYSEADSGARHTRVADAAIHIGPAPARESYLNIDALLRAARACGAQAVHPGYGFLSESAEFAERCAKAGLTFVGPSAPAIEAMGVKDQAKSLMQRSGVPIVPGYLGENQDEKVLAKEAQRIGFPLLIKAVAGGGGKGMRVVRAADEFAAALSAARGESERAFGDARVMLERYIEKARHVEVQIIADRHGNTLHLFERDCSLQRRYQKVIEEAPAPDLSDDLRQKLHLAAVAAARAVNYENAGTVEFVTDGKEFFFLEMNTRLQVEHPVTEAILGIDLVEWQLRVAAGEKLPLKQDELHPIGHAFEARVYAEDPRRNFLPSGGCIKSLTWPQDARIDAAVESGDRVVTDYDALLAKLIVHGPDRESALQRLTHALRSSCIEGVTTNLPALIALSTSPDVEACRIHTRWIDEHMESLLPDAASQTARAAAMAAAALLMQRGVRARAPNSPWEQNDAWTLQDQGTARVRLQAADGESFVSLCTRAAEGWRIEVGGQLYTVTCTANVAVDSDQVSVWLEGEWHRFARISRAGDAAAGVSDGTLQAPMPGLVLAVPVKAQDKVQRGQPLIVLEAMKMEHTLIAAGPGAITEVLVRPGERVREGDALLKIEPKVG